MGGARQSKRRARFAGIAAWPRRHSVWKIFLQKKVCSPKEIALVVDNNDDRLTIGTSRGGSQRRTVPGAEEAGRAERDPLDRNSPSYSSLRKRGRDHFARPPAGPLM